MQVDSELLYNPWISELHGIKYTKSVWIKKQLIQYFKLHPQANRGDAKKWIEHGNTVYLENIKEDLSFDFKDGYFRNICSSIRKTDSNNYALQPYKFTVSVKHDIVNIITFYLDDFSLKQCAEI